MLCERTETCGQFEFILRSRGGYELEDPAVATHTRTKRAWTTCASVVPRPHGAETIDRKSHSMPTLFSAVCCASQRREES